MSAHVCLIVGVEPVAADFWGRPKEREHSMTTPCRLRKSFSDWRVRWDPIVKNTQMPGDMDGVDLATLHYDVIPVDISN